MEVLKTTFMPDKRFKIAFSFAGEKRDYVAKVAHILADKFGEKRILYDKYHETEFAVFDLGIKLPRLYSQESELIVPVLCPEYDNKRWTGWEWAHIYSLLTGPDGNRVLPSRFEYAAADGLSAAAGFIELDKKTPEQFANLILQRLALNEGKYANYYTKTDTPTAYVQPHTSIKHNLPKLQPFFGRERELKAIADALDPDNRTWGALIDGPGGMGKTSLAVRAAYDTPTGAFDRIIFISLKNRELDDDGERDLSGFVITGLQELFNELAQELGHVDIAQAVMDQRPRLLVDALRGSRTLLVLDSLESLTKGERDILFTFVKRLPDGCKTILTSRGRIGSGAEELILDQLDESSALETLAELALHNRELAKTSQSERLQLYHATGGKPLLLRWIAGQIGRDHCISISHAIDYLRSCPVDNDALAFVFTDLVQDFTDAETKALSALAYFSLPAKAQHIAAVTENSVEEIETALRILVNRSLVLPSMEFQAFTLMPLVADFLHKHRPHVLAEISNRLENYVYALIAANGYKNHDRFPVLEAAWPTIAAALPAFVIGENRRLQDVCSALAVFLNSSGRWDELISVSGEAEKRAGLDNDWISAGWRAHDIGVVHYSRGQAELVIECADRAEQYWQKSQKAGNEEFFAWRLRGSGYELTKNYSSARTSYKRALAISRGLNPVSEDVALSLNALANVEKMSGSYEDAERYYNAALEITETIGSVEGAAIYNGNLSILALDQQDWLKAERFAIASLNYSEKGGYLELIGANYQRLAQALTRTGKVIEAQSYAKQALDIFHRLSNTVQVEISKAILKETQKFAECIYVENIELKNIRCFEDVKIDFLINSHLSLSNVMLGDNSSGKSTILRSLAICLCNERDATALLASLPGTMIRHGADFGQIKISL
jgi:tetratricopeptide (TPR) repeat protein